MSKQDPTTGAWKTNPIEGVPNEHGGRSYAVSDGRQGAPIPAMANHPEEMLRSAGPQPLPRTLPPPKFVYCLTEYTDDRGRVVSERVVVDGEAPESFTRFVGKNGVRVSPQVARQIGGRDVSAYVFPIEAETLLQAFNAWERAAREFGALHVRQLEQRYAASTDAGPEGG